MGRLRKGEESHVNPQRAERGCQVRGGHLGRGFPSWGGGGGLEGGAWGAQEQVDAKAARFLC